MKNAAWTKRSLDPFGMEVSAAASATSPEEISVPILKDWIGKARYVLLRGFAPLSTEAMMRLARTLGKPLEWEFGAINELVAKPDARNYILSLIHI